METEPRLSRRLPRMRAVSTATVAAHERFDFWHSLFTDVDMAPLDPRGHAYRAAVLSCAGDNGLLFADLGCDPTAARFAEGMHDTMRLTVMTRGSIHVSHGDDERTIVSPGPGLYLSDYARASIADSASGYRGYVVELPRALVYRAMGSEPISGRSAIRLLPDTPLSLLLKDMFHSLGRCGPDMDAQELSAAMNALTGLSLAYLQRFHPETNEPDDADDTLFVAACKYIDTYKHSPGLTAAAIAAAAGCSRARLYRLFEGRGLTVSDQIREARLNYSRTLLRNRLFDIGDIALRCGYADQSAFGKAFRRQFGMTPSDWRRALAEPS